jgi:hypothetical protein
MGRTSPLQVLLSELDAVLETTAAAQAGTGGPSDDELAALVSEVGRLPEEVEGLFRWPGRARVGSPHDSRFALLDARTALSRLELLKRTQPDLLAAQQTVVPIAVGAGSLTVFVQGSDCVPMVAEIGGPQRSLDRAQHFYDWLRELCSRWQDAVPTVKMTWLQWVEDDLGGQEIRIPHTDRRALVVLLHRLRDARAIRCGLLPMITFRLGNTPRYSVAGNPHAITDVAVVLREEAVEQLCRELWSAKRRQFSIPDLPGLTLVFSDV